MADECENEQVLSMTSAEAVSIVDMFRERMARGWIPDLDDIAGALALLRRDPAVARHRAARVARRHRLVASGASDPPEVGRR